MGSYSALRKKKMACLESYALLRLSRQSEGTKRGDLEEEAEEEEEEVYSNSSANQTKEEEGGIHGVFSFP